LSTNRSFVLTTTAPVGPNTPPTISLIPDQGVAAGNSLAGYPVAFNAGVSGKVNRQSDREDLLVRASGGDWNQCAYGVGMDNTIRSSDVASYVDSEDVTHSAFQDNLVLILAEAYFGFVTGDAGAFVRYVTEPAGS
jgi:hypothetical protein